jgi:HK97 family phage major capsid protein
MKKSAELRQERALKIKAQQDLTALATTETRALNAEETVSFNGIQTEVESLTEQIRIAEIAETNQRSLEGSESVFVVEGQENRQAEKPVFSLHRAIRSQMVNGGVKMDGPELEMHERAMKSAATANIPVSGFGLEMRATAQTVTGDSGTAGGNLVKTDLQSPIDFLRPEPLMKKLGASYLTGLTGNLRYPKNEGGIVATWEGETDTTDPTANTYGYVDSLPKRLSVTVPISLQNLMQSNIDLELYTVKEINAAIENAIDAAAINGSGIGQPIGVLNASGTNSVVTGTDGSAPTWDMIVDAETGVFVANASSAKMSYVVNPQTRGKLKKTKHAAGDLNYIMDKSGEVNGYPSVASNHVPGNLTKGTGTNLSALAFGDWSQLLINQWGYMDISVDETSQKKKGFIEITVNVFLDVLVKQPKAFSVVKGLITA